MDFKPPLFKVKQKIHRHVHQSTSTEPICIDLTVLHPVMPVVTEKERSHWRMPFFCRGGNAKMKQWVLNSLVPMPFWVHPDDHHFLRQTCFRKRQHH